MATRLLTDISTVVKADGTGFMCTPRMAEWCKGTISAQANTSNNISWTVGISVDGATIAHKTGFGIGATVVSGPFLLAPGEYLAVAFSGGTPGDNVSGTVYGAQGIDPSKITADSVYGATITSSIVGAITGNVGIVGNVPVLNAAGDTLNTKQPQTLLASYTVAVGATDNRDITIPADTHSIMIMRGQSTASRSNWDLLFVKGNQSQFTYLLDQTINEPPTINVVPISQLVDSTIHVQVKNNAFNLDAGAVWIVAILDTEAVFAQSAGYNLGQQGIVLSALQPILTVINPANVTYSGALDFTLAANPTDIFVISGSATKTVGITRISVQMNRTAAGVVTVALVRRSTANTIGTLNSINPIAHDSSSPGNTVNQLGCYTANPATGTFAGTIREGQLGAPTPTGYPIDKLEWTFGDRYQTQPLTLRGITQLACLNIPGAPAIAGAQASVAVEWMEF